MKPAILFVLRGYKRWISPMLPHACRFVPTCSEYSMEAVERYGAIKGSWLAVRRLLRCQPFARAGFDPVPAETNCAPPLHAQVDSAALDSACGPIHRHYGMESHIGRI